MDTLLARYLDGELDEEEARDLLERLERDANLAAELREYERILAGAQLLKDVSAPEGFTDAVMGRIAQERIAERVEPASVPFAARLRWRWALALAAVLVLAFALGRMTLPNTRSANDATRMAQTPSTLNLGQQPRAEVASLVTTGTPSTSSEFRVVRLIYTPSHEDLQSVFVAGTFNNWNPHSLPLQKTGSVWTATLVLPPGAYEYMFVENGKRWVTDPRASLTRDDGFGNRNAVLDVGA